MNYKATWEISGTDIDTAGTKFIQSAQKSIKNLKKYESKLDKIFKKNINDNMARAGMDADNLSDVFSLYIDNSNIIFVNTAPLVTQRYEYGYYDGSKDTTEEYYEEYMIQTSPKYFIRPAIQDTLNDVGQILLNEAKRQYG